MSAHELNICYLSKHPHLLRPAIWSRCRHAANADMSSAAAGVKSLFEGSPTCTHPGQEDGCRKSERDREISRLGGRELFSRLE